MIVSACSVLLGQVSVIAEPQIHPFKFYMDSAVCAGMRYNRGLYKQAQFHLADRSKAYQLAYQLAEAGTPVVVSVSAERYTVWSRIFAS